jgi:cell division protein FtsW
MNTRQGTMDWPLFAAVLLMISFGIVLVYSSSFALAQSKYGVPDFFLTRQSVRALLAVTGFMICINIDYHLWGRWSGIAYVAAIALLLSLLFLPESHSINGARRWLSLGPLQFQVSDFARLALVLFLARQCEKTGDEIRNPAVFIRLLAVVGVICGLILLEPNFSTALVLGVISFAILFVAGARFWHLGGIVLAALPVAALLVLRTPYRRARLMSFLDLSNHSETVGYQTFQSLVGLGNGGLFGVGLGRGEQKYFYLPEPHTDFIFSILGEEIGFIGLLVVIGAMGFIVYRGIRIALSAPDQMGRLMAFGFTFAVALYAVINASVATGIVPTTGLPMPFLSYGGMSLILTMCSMGIVLNISTRTVKREPIPGAGGKRP